MVTQIAISNTFPLPHTDFSSQTTVQEQETSTSHSLGGRKVISGAISFSSPTVMKTLVDLGLNAAPEELERLSQIQGDKITSVPYLRSIPSSNTDYCIYFFRLVVLIVAVVGGYFLAKYFDCF